MQPNDPYNPQQPTPDLPDAALPSIEPVYDQPAPATPPPSPAPPQVPTPQTPPASQYASEPQPAQPQPTPQPPQAATPPPPEQNPLLPPQSPTNQNQQAEPNQGRHHLSSVGKKYFQFVEFDDEEVLLAEIRKHPFGLFIIIFTGIFVALMLLIGVVAVATSSFLETLGFGNANAIVVFVGFLLSLFVILVTGINAHLYRNNVVFVTNEKLAQILFITLFNRKLSQLSIGDIQDVTVQQNGFIPNLVGYGTLVVETAGEQQNYTFTFVPTPYETSKVIINAHEMSIRHYGN